MWWYLKLLMNQMPITSVCQLFLGPKNPCEDPVLVALFKTCTSPVGLSHFGRMYRRRRPHPHSLSHISCQETCSCWNLLSVTQRSRRTPPQGQSSASYRWSTSSPPSSLISYRMTLKQLHVLKLLLEGLKVTFRGLLIMETSLRCFLPSTQPWLLYGVLRECF